MSDNAVEALGWEEYSRQSLHDYRKLLDRDNITEKEMQSFFEKNPSFIPGAFGMGVDSGHLPLFSTLISQPNLSGYSSRIPDFLWIAFDSCTIYPVLIEIESPKKKWFILSGQQSADFTQAQNQLSDWKVWFNNPSNLDNFLKHYGVVSIKGFRSKVVKPQYVLIYGRASETEDNESLNKKRSIINGADTHYMTYDRLSPNPKCSNIITTSKKDNEYKAMYFSPTFKVGPLNASDLKMIHLKEAALNNSVIAEDRKEFLSQRFPYWENYIMTNHGSLMCDDWE